jgi:hypothetical protein
MKLIIIKNFQKITLIQMKMIFKIMIFEEFLYGNSKFLFEKYSIILLFINV